MLNNAIGFARICIACGYTDLRQGIYGLTAVIRLVVLPNEPLDSIRFSAAKHKQHFSGTGQRLIGDATAVQATLGWPVSMTQDEAEVRAK